eukprot:gene4249-3071_t
MTHTKQTNKPKCNNHTVCCWCCRFHIYLHIYIYIYIYIVEGIPRVYFTVLNQEIFYYFLCLAPPLWCSLLVSFGEQGSSTVHYTFSATRHVEHSLGPHHQALRSSNRSYLCCTESSPHPSLPIPIPTPTPHIYRRIVRRSMTVLTGCLNAYESRNECLKFVGSHCMLAILPLTVGCGFMPSHLSRTPLTAVHTHYHYICLFDHPNHLHHTNAVVTF